MLNCGYIKTIVLYIDRVHRLKSIASDLQNKIFTNTDQHCVNLTLL